MKKSIRLLALALCASSVAVSMASCGAISRPTGEDDPEDPTKTTVKVYNFDGGIGTDWLRAAEKAFEAKYANQSFEEGKTGVNIRVFPGKASQQTVATQPYDVFFTESVFYNDLVVEDLVLDISDIVKAPLSNINGCNETGTIEDKLFDEQKEALTALDGNYYVLPHYECYSGISYDRDLFNQKSFFIKEGTGTTQFTNLNGNLSVGPDGIRGSYDDGLPSSYEEFYNLMKRMVQLNVEPFIYTGKFPSYTNHLLSGAWAAYTGKDAWMLNVNFDSNYMVEDGGEPVKSKIITKFKDGEPVIEETLITPETGYKLSQEAGKYYALSFFQTIMSKAENLSTKISGVSSHLDAQSDYLFSALDGEPIAMIIEGSYWYNEAKDALAATANAYPETGVNRNFSFMPLPRQVSGQVTEGNGTKNTLFDALSAYGFISSSVKGDKAVETVAKLFLQYCYTDEALLAFTESTSIFKGVKYEVDPDVFKGMSKYAENMYNIRSNSDIIHPISDSKIFVNAQTKFYYNVDTTCWESKISGTPYSYPQVAFSKGQKAVDYFKGMAMSENAWKSSYSDYFD